MITKRVLLLAGIVLLGVFYFFVMSKVFQPDVSEHYRAYYIDKRFKYRNAGIIMLVRPGTSIDFTRKVPQLSPIGWSSPDTNGTRLTKSFASIFLQRDTTSNPPTNIIIESRSSIIPNTSQIEVTVLMNNQRAGTLLYGSHIPDKLQVLPVPPKALGNNRKRLLMTFSTRNSLRSAIISIKSITFTAPGSPGEVFIEQVKRKGL
ncbi:MAG: hypothetical protein MI685_11790 [Chlorobiales bacterium]|nr:hypothetical protein [Chlorobiales bacterium]